MTIELYDMDLPYALQTDCNDKGKDFIRITPRYGFDDQDDNYNICLTKEQAKELARVLMFMAKEL